MARLINETTGESWSLGTRTSIGRDQANQIPLNDRLASRSHAEIRRSDRGFEVVDLGSSYGTFVGGERVTESALSNGDELQVGMTKFRFEQDSDSMGAEVAETSTAVQARAALETIDDSLTPQDDAALRKAYERLRAAYEVGRVLAAERELEPLLERICETVMSSIRCDRVAALLYENGSLQPRLVRDRNTNSPNMVLSQTILNEVATTRQALLLADAGSDPRFESAQSVQIEGIRSAMCAPLVVGDELVGALHVDSLMAKGMFTQEDLSLLSTVSLQVALAIKNFQLVKSWNEELEREVVARTDELRDAQALLVTTQRAAAMSALGAGISHEINNPLTGILGMAQLLKRKSEGPQQHRMLSTIESEAMRIQEIVQTMQRLTEDTSTLTLRPTELNDVVRSALQVVSGAIRDAKIVVEEDLGEPPPVPADSRALQEALLHVINNAITAMREGGTLTVSTGLVERVATVKVRDTGAGISADVLDRIFDPFFTTKAEWQSKGLGLPVAYRILQEHSGRIRVDSEVGQGTVVTFQLPTGTTSAHLL